jgi:hypothetical protein
MTIPAELTRLRRDIESLIEEVATNSGPRARSPLTAGDKRALKAEIQGLIQQLDELAGKLS